MLMIISIFLPIIMGAILLVSSFLEHLKDNNDYATVSKDKLLKLHLYTLVGLITSAVLALVAAQKADVVTLFHFTENLTLSFKADALSLFFVAFISLVFIAVAVYSTVYMQHEKEEKRFFGFYLIVYGVLVGLDFSANLLTLYLFYEFMTLSSMPFVLHNGSKESIMASLKYLFYSMCGAYFALFGIFVINHYAPSLEFVAGGHLSGSQPAIVLIAVFSMLVGFGAKAGMFPLHAWLPSAHPVAPSPASAVLSSIIVKCGVFAIIRVVYYLVGAKVLSGTWVQTTWIILALLTVFMGSLLAFREPVLKKRLAYSSVSQVSYILFGLALLNVTGFKGALLHTIFHAFIKCALFLVAGVLIFKLHINRVDEVNGLGKKMPITLWCFTIASLGLIGIPPTSGFISKWYLALGALDSSLGAIRFVGPAVLLISALLTAGYLLEIVVKGFFPEEKVEVVKEKEEPRMWVPLLVLASLTVLLGLLPNGLLAFISQIANSLM